MEGREEKKGEGRGGMRLREEEVEMGNRKMEGISWIDRDKDKGEVEEEGKWGLLAREERRGKVGEEGWKGSKMKCRWRGYPAGDMGGREGGGRVKVAAY